jgi:osmoprotectant transport system substrate-binding protein
MAAFAAAAVIALAGCGGGSESNGGGGIKRPEITIGTKNFTEQFILGELYRQALEANGIRVRLKSDIGSSEIVDRALTAGSLDMYPEYTGTLLSEVAGERKRPRSSAEAYEGAKRFSEKRGFTLLEMTPFSDSNALAVTPTLARTKKVRSIADLAKLPSPVLLAAPPEFRTRFEGLVGLRELYRLGNLKALPVPIGEQYDALDTGAAQVANVFTTDGQLDRGRYAVLSDPRTLFGFQNVAPVIRRELVRENPKLATIINSVSEKLTTSAMRAMNAAAVQRKDSPRVVAARFLHEKGLVPPPMGR